MSKLDALQASAPSGRSSAPARVSFSFAGLTALLLSYVLLSMIASALQSSTWPRRTVSQNRAHPATGAFGTTRSTDEPRHIQLARAQERGRGRHAIAPWQVPWAGWKDILWRTYQQISEDRLLAVAAGVVFYTLLALFPSITALVSLYGLFTNAATINEHISLAAGLLPAGGVDIVEEQVKRIASKGDTKLGFTFLSAWDWRFGAPMPG